MVKITFLGTGSSKGCPRPGHTDLLCRDAQKRGSKSARQRSSVFIQTEDAHILIDAGPDVLEQLTAARVKRIDAVFLTHEHADATGGLKLLNAWLATRTQRIPLYGFPRTIEKSYRSQYAALEPMRLVALNGVDVKGTEVMPFAVRHGVKHDVPTAGFRIGGFVYASDMDAASWTSMWIMRGARVLALDAALWSIRSLPGHLTVSESIGLARKLKPTQLLLTQLGHTFPPHDEADKLVRSYAKLKDVRFSVHLAYDGLHIKIP
jgi:phosphoribosyl 1,2-cyclic phosphate phosphodiesterase